MAENNNSRDFTVGVILGAVIGASTALLFAPKSGRETRSDLSMGAQQMKYRAGEFKDMAAEKSSDWKDKAYTTGSELKRKQ